MKILLVENDHGLIAKVESLLHTEGHRCEIITSYADALAASACYYYDVIVCNIASLDGDELELISFLKNSKLDRRAILTFHASDLISAREIDSLGMASLPKPYTAHALYQRITSTATRSIAQDGRVLSVNELTIDITGRFVQVKNQAVDLTRLEYDLLLYFVSNKNVVISRNVLAQYLLRESRTATEDFGFLYAHIKNLKKKLKAAGCQDYIKTVYGIGYRFSL